MIVSEASVTVISSLTLPCGQVYVSINISLHDQWHANNVVSGLSQTFNKEGTANGRR